jgi:hypothetical protein
MGTYGNARPQGFSGASIVGFQGFSPSVSLLGGFGPPGGGFMPSPQQRFLMEQTRIMRDQAHQQLIRHDPRVDDLMNILGMDRGDNFMRDLIGLGVNTLGRRIFGGDIRNLHQATTTLFNDGIMEGGKYRAHSHGAIGRAVTSFANLNMDQLIRDNRLNFDQMEDVMTTMGAMRSFGVSSLDSTGNITTADSERILNQLKKGTDIFKMMYDIFGGGTAAELFSMAEKVSGLELSRGGNLDLTQKIISNIKRNAQVMNVSPIDAMEQTISSISSFRAAGYNPMAAAMMGSIVSDAVVSHGNVFNNRLRGTPGFENMLPFDQQLRMGLMENFALRQAQQHGTMERERLSMLLSAEYAGVDLAPELRRAIIGMTVDNRSQVMGRFERETELGPAYRDLSRRNTLEQLTAQAAASGMGGDLTEILMAASTEAGRVSMDNLAVRSGINDRTQREVLGGAMSVFGGQVTMRLLEASLETDAGRRQAIIDNVTRQAVRTFGQERGESLVSGTMMGFDGMTAASRQRFVTTYRSDEKTHDTALPGRMSEIDSRMADLNAAAVLHEADIAGMDSTPLAFRLLHGVIKGTYNQNQAEDLMMGHVINREASVDPQNALFRPVFSFVNKENLPLEELLLNDGDFRRQFVKSLEEADDGRIMRSSEDLQRLADYLRGDDLSREGLADRSSIFNRFFRVVGTSGGRQRVMTHADEELARQVARDTLEGISDTPTEDRIAELMFSGDSVSETAYYAGRDAALETAYYAGRDAALFLSGDVKFINTLGIFSSSGRGAIRRMTDAQIDQFDFTVANMSDEELARFVPDKAKHRQLLDQELTQRGATAAAARIKQYTQDKITSELFMGTVRFRTADGAEVVLERVNK